MVKSTVDELVGLITRLQAERQTHLDAIARIDNAFARLGLAAPAGAPRRGPGRPRKNPLPLVAAPAAAAGKKGRRKRRRFSVPGWQMILNVVKAGGKDGATSADIVKRWRSENRSGDPYTQMGELVKQRKLKRQPLPGKLGSRYVLP